jgi:RNA polymerase sigma factor (sigma-70 family)
VNADVVAAVDGDRDALERIVRDLQPDLHRLALRFFGCPYTAQDATQEALIQIITRLDRFEHRSEFRTWAYRVAINRFASIRRSPAEREAGSFAEFDEDLARPPTSGAHPHPDDVDEALLIEEVRIGCTLAMMLCLDRGHRLAYILGEIMELEHNVAAEVLGITPAAYRKRLQRARADITGVMRRRCGVFDERNPCRCKSRIPEAIARRRIDPHELVYASTRDQARQFPEVLVNIRQLETAARTAAIYRSHPDPRSNTDLVGFIRALVDTASDLDTDT